MLAPAKAFWNGGLLASAFAFAPFTFTVDALLVFVATTYATLLLGHSVGMHRRVIHKSFDCAKWLERALVYLGVVVGMAGPLGLLRVHDIRDWPNASRTVMTSFRTAGRYGSTRFGSSLASSNSSARLGSRSSPS